MSVAETTKVTLAEMLEKARKQYLDYTNEQESLLKNGKADPEWVALMETAADHTDKLRAKFWEVYFPHIEYDDYDNPHIGRNGTTKTVPKPKQKPKKDLSQEERDARLFEDGANWLTRNKWTRGWHNTASLPSGRLVDARCALGSILAVHLDMEEGDHSPNNFGNGELERALGRVGLNADSVISWNDSSAVDGTQVAKFLRGVAYAIREGFRFDRDE